MLKTRLEMAKEVIDSYNQAYMQGETMDHIQEWIIDQIKVQKKQSSITIDDDGLVTDIERGETPVCDCCGSQTQYIKVSFSQSFIPILQKVLLHCVSHKIKTSEHINLVCIRDLPLSHTEYTIMNKISNFGLLYRETIDGKKIKRGIYGVPQKRIFDFLSGSWSVAQYYLVKSTTGERVLSKARVMIDQIQSDQLFIDYKTNQLPKYVDYILFDNVQKS